MFMQQTKNILYRVGSDHRVRVDRASFKARITLATSRRIKSHLTPLNRKGRCWAGRNAITAIVASPDGVRVVTGHTIEIAALKEQNHPVARSINTGPGQNFTNLRLQGAHLRPPGVYVEGSRYIWRPRPLERWCLYGIRFLH